MTKLATSETDGAKDKLRNENQRTVNIDDDNRMERQLINQIHKQKFLLVDYCRRKWD